MTSISLKTIYLLRNTLFLERGVQDRFFLENLDHSPTFLLFSLVLGDPFQVGLSPSDIPVVLGSIPIAIRHHDAILDLQHQGLKPSLVPISIPCGD